MKTPRSFQLALASVLLIAFSARAAAQAAPQAAKAAPRSPDITVRLASFTAVEDLVAAVANAVGQPMIGISVPAMARAQLAQIGKFDSEAPWQVALWFERPEKSASPAKSDDDDDDNDADDNDADDNDADDVIDAIDDVQSMPPVAAAVVKVPLSGVDLSSVRLPPAEELADKGIEITAGADALVASINLAKTYADESVAFSIPGFLAYDNAALTAAAEPEFAKAPVDATAAIETVVLSPEKYAEAIRPYALDSDLVESARSLGLDNPQGLSDMYWQFASGDLSGSSRIVQCAKLVGDEALVFTTLMEAKPGTGLERKFAAYETLDAAAVSALADAPIFVVSAANPEISKAGAGLFRSVLLPLIDALKKRALEEVGEDDAAKVAVVGGMVSGISDTIAQVLDSATGACSMRFGRDAAGHPALSASLGVSDPAPARMFLAGVRAAAQAALEAAAAEDSDFPKDAIVLSDAADADKFMVSVSADSLAKCIADDDGEESEKASAVELLAKARELLGDGVNVGYSIKEADGGANLAVSYGSIGATFDGIPPVNGTSLLATLPGDARPYMVGAFSVSRLLKAIVDFRVKAGDVTQEQGRLFAEMAASVSNESRIGFAGGAYPSSNVVNVTIPLSELASVANFVTFSQMVEPGFDDADDDDDANDTDDDGED